MTPSTPDQIRPHAAALPASLLSAAALADGAYLLGAGALPQIAAFWLLTAYLVLAVLVLPLLLQPQRGPALGPIAMALGTASLGSRLGGDPASATDALPQLLLIGAAVLSRAGAIRLPRRMAALAAG